jgi:hypothetical protein
MVNMTYNASTEQKQALAKLMAKADIINDPKMRFALATKIVKWVVTDVYTQDLVSLIADTETFNPGEQIQFHTLRELKAYILEPGSSAKRSKLVKDSVPLPHHRAYVGTQLDLGQLRSGRYGTLTDLNRKVSEVLLGKRNQLLWDTMNFSIESTTTDSNYATFASSAAVATKKAAVDAGIVQIHDVANNGPQAIVGRYAAIDWMEDISAGTNLDNWLPEFSKEQYMRSGFITFYRGVPVFRLRQYRDADRTQMVGSDDIHIISQGTIKFGRVLPGLESFNQINGATYSWEIDFWEEYGVAAINTYKNYRINVT